MNIFGDYGKNIFHKIFSSQREIKEEENSFRAPFYPETTEVIDKVYNDYKESLLEVPFEKIRKSALEVSINTQVPKKDVLQAMQLLTQFSNMKSLKEISKTFNREDLNYLGNSNRNLEFLCKGNGLTEENTYLFQKETGIHSSLIYLCNQKNLAPFDYKFTSKIGVVLDKEKIEQLEQVKQSQPEEYQKIINSKNLKFFYISGWETGIPVIDRTKKIEEKTVELLNLSKTKNIPLEQAIDFPYLDRIKELGIKPILIKNQNIASEFTVYNQMRPEKINTKNNLYNLIEANTLSRFKDATQSRKALVNHVTAKNLDRTLSVYTPEKMSKELKDLYDVISDIANRENREVIYVVPNGFIKSFDLLNYSYKKINNISPKNFILIDEIKQFYKSHPERNKDNTLFVFLDDCSLSGNSVVEILSKNSLNLATKTPLLFATLKTSELALNNMNCSRHLNQITYMDKVPSQHCPIDELEKIIGHTMYSSDTFSLVFPYMAPDNNSEFVGNVALLHNIKYNSQNFSSDLNRNFYTDDEIDSFPLDEAQKFRNKRKEDYSYINSVKSLTDDVLKTSAKYAKLIGAEPVLLDENSRTLSAKELNKVADEILS